MNQKSIILFILIILQIFALALDNQNYSMIILSTVFSFSVLYCLAKPAERSALLAFDISFFILLLSRLYIPLIYDIEKLSYNSGFIINKILLTDIYNQLSIAILSITTAYHIFEKKNVIINNPISFNTPNIISLRKTAKYISIFLSVFFLYKVYLNILSNMTYGYMSLYDGSSSYNAILSFTADKFNFCMYMYFATMPKKKEAIPMLWLFFLANAITIFTGQRNSFILPLIFCILYLIIRNKVNNEGKVWLSKKTITIMLILAPFLMISMYAIMILRSGETIEKLNPIDGFISSIYQLGSSIEVIHNSILYQETLRQQDFYSLSEFYNFIIYNPISSLFLNIPHYAPGTIELATQGKSLGNSLTYIDNPARFFNYGSIGSSYVSECWLDFGFLGIILFSFLYGYILSYLWKGMTKNVWIIFGMFVILTQIIYAPRYSASSFFVELIETKSWPYLLVFYLSYKNKRFHL